MPCKPVILIFVVLAALGVPVFSVAQNTNAPPRNVDRGGQAEAERQGDVDEASRAERRSRVPADRQASREDLQDDDGDLQQPLGEDARLRGAGIPERQRDHRPAQQGGPRRRPGQQ